MKAKDARIAIQKQLFPNDPKQHDGILGKKSTEAFEALKSAPADSEWPTSQGVTEEIDQVGPTKIYRKPDGKITFTAGGTINADGSPRAYGPNGKGLDHLANAGSPRNWWGIAVDSNGNPYIQGPNDPAPGYYVSTTALTNPGFANRDPRRYVDSEKVNFMVLPGKWKWGDQLGDRWTIENLETGKKIDAIYADIGPRDKIGEISIAAAVALGIPANPKNGGTSKPILRYTQA